MSNPGGSLISADLKLISLAAVFFRWGHGRYERPMDGVISDPRHLVSLVQ